VKENELPLILITILVPRNIMNFDFGPCKNLQ